MAETTIDQLIDALGDAQARIGRLYDLVADLETRQELHGQRLSALERPAPLLCATAELVATTERGEPTYTREQINAAVQAEIECYGERMRPLLLQLGADVINRLDKE